jgi:putative Mg2+ transporter-C (MgtC) family protein
MGMHSYDLLGMFMAAIFGALIGAERQLSGKAAGLRTNILICLGAAVYTIVSREMGGQSDSITRIAAQIVSGIGFLGAGAIIQDRGGVHGLTTAATIWLVASIGMGCGAGFYLLASVATAIAVIVLLALAPLDKWLTNFGQKHNLRKHLDEQHDSHQL